MSDVDDNGDDSGVTASPEGVSPYATHPNHSRSGSWSSRAKKPELQSPQPYVCNWERRGARVRRERGSLSQLRAILGAVRIFVGSLMGGAFCPFREAASGDIAMLGDQPARAEDCPVSPTSARVARLAGVRSADVVALWCSTMARVLPVSPDTITATERCRRRMEVSSTAPGDRHRALPRRDRRRRPRRGQQ